MLMARAISPATGMATDRGRCWGASGVEIAVPRARLATADGKTTEWKSTAAGLPTANQAGRFAYWRLSCRHQYATGAPGAVGGLRGCGQQGYVEPGVAEGEGRLGRLKCPLTGRAPDRPLDPRWHRGAGPARPEGHLDRAPGRARRA
jgi:hypothetical protein